MSRSFAIRESMRRLAQLSALPIDASLPLELVRDPLGSFGVSKNGTATLLSILAGAERTSEPEERKRAKRKRSDPMLAAIMERIAETAIEAPRKSDRPALSRRERVRPPIAEAAIEDVAARLLAAHGGVAFAPSLAPISIPPVERTVPEIDADGLRELALRSPMTVEAARTEVRRVREAVRAEERSPGSSGSPSAGGSQPTIVAPSSDARRSSSDAPHDHSQLVPVASQGRSQSSPRPRSAPKGLRGLTEWWSEAGSKRSVEHEHEHEHEHDDHFSQDRIAGAPSQPVSPSRDAIAPREGPRVSPPEDARSLRREIERILEHEAQRFGIDWEEP